jgi:hypothetical protein
VSAYRAFVIGSDGLAIAVHDVEALNDDDALEKARQLQRGAEPLEVWCGSRKVGNIHTNANSSEGT